MKLRLASFLIALGIGLAAGLVYGWVINPARQAELSPDALRMDYKADFVLMAAQIYAADHNLERAASQIAALGQSSPALMAQKAVLWGSQANYAPGDLKLMANLAAALQVRTPPAPGATP
ncbi:MAG: hypothetical protein PHQ40_04335 [Anaerolineaceae bacterium]|nr:hypothetical protein [Anaerolineaceae bacterium]